jgi:predicted transcriptional regulator
MKKMSRQEYSKLCERIDKQILAFLLKNEHHQQIRQTTLCQALFGELTNRMKGRVFNAMRRLEAAGLVERGIQLTEAGRKMMEENLSK